VRTLVKLMVTRLINSTAPRYKEYQKIQDILSGKVTIKDISKKQKRSHSDPNPPETPSKRRRSLHDSPQTEALLSPPQDEEQDPNTPAVKRTFIGPTPQKDGIVLGIFDLLPTNTPSKTRTVLGDLTTNIAVTPSKSLDTIRESPHGHEYEERARGSRTPASSGKRFMLDSFLTPQKRQKIEDNAITPSSSFKQLLTPAFLKRDNFVMTMIDEAPPTPQASQLPWKRRAFGRSLSGMIQDIRREQEKDADEELDLLREMEDEADGITREPKPAPKIVVEHSQVATGLDRDGFVPSDVDQSASEDEKPQQQAADGKPRKPWKKKGLKRQTRRVKMRPVVKKAQPLAEANESVADSQLAEDVLSDVEAGSDSEDDEDDEFSGTRAKPKTKPKEKEKEKTTDKEAPKKNTRKVKAGAHANYRALKIKNKNSKGKGGGGGRFGRRR
jgi:hypothetical protein